MKAEHYLALMGPPPHCHACASNRVQPRYPKPPGPLAAWRCVKCGHQWPMVEDGTGEEEAA